MTDQPRSCTDVAITPAMTAAGIRAFRDFAAAQIEDQVARIYHAMRLAAQEAWKDARPIHEILAEIGNDMPMLPNDHHPGPRCSCRECLVTFPLSKFTAAPQECAPVMGAVGNSSSPPCETDVKPAVAACLIRYPDAEKEEPNIDALYNDPRKQVHDVMYQQGWEAAVTAMDQEIEALKHDNARLVQTNADLASELADAQGGMKPAGWLYCYTTDHWYWAKYKPVGADVVHATQIYAADGMYPSLFTDEP